MTVPANYGTEYTCYMVRTVPHKPIPLMFSFRCGIGQIKCAELVKRVTQINDINKHAFYIFTMNQLVKDSKSFKPVI